MKITIARQELLELWQGLALLGNLKGFRLGYAIARTRAKIKPEVEALEEALNPSAAFVEYEKKRLKICREHARKDDAGEPLIQGNQFVFVDREDFETELAPVAAEYAQAIEDREKQIEDYNAGLKELITVEVHQIAETDIPEDVTAQQVGVLYPLLIKEKEHERLYQQ